MDAVADAASRDAAPRHAWLPGPLVRAVGLLVLLAVIAAAGCRRGS